MLKTNEIANRLINFLAYYFLILGSIGKAHLQTFYEYKKNILGLYFSASNTVKISYTKRDDG